MKHARTWATLIAASGVAVLIQPAAAQTPAAAAPPAVGTYELVEVGGTPLPTTVEETAECVERVTAGTLTLEEDGEWEIELTESETCGTDVSDDTESEEGEYTVEGTAIDFQPDEEEGEDDADEPDELDLDELSTGTLDGDVIRVRIRGTEMEAVFRRVES